MAHGLRIWDGGGSIVLGTSDRLTRQIDVFRVGRHSSGSRQVSGFSAALGGAFAIKDEENTLGSPHQVTVSGDTVYYEPSIADQTIGGQELRSPSLIIVFHYL